MATIFDSTPSDNAKNILKLLKASHNVIISGPPATGKSRLLAEIRYWFKKPTTPSFQASGNSAFPSGQDGQSNTLWHPSPKKSDREVFQITFHQGTKYRDFVSGLVPDTSASTNNFKIVNGKFYQAAKYSENPNGTALLEIDEINRANAVSVFGDTITAIESDKRLLEDGTVGELSAVFSTLDASGELIDSHLSSHLYIIAAMNNADTSVQPLDVAFLRRWENYVLRPDEDSLREYYSLGPKISILPASPTTAQDIYELMVQAWIKVNFSISLLRGDDYQIGQGIFMKIAKDDIPTTVPEALEVASQGWNRLFSHISEVFFGDIIGLSNVISANVSNNPYQLETKFFGGVNISRIAAPKALSTIEIYNAMLAIVNADT